MKLKKRYDIVYVTMRCFFTCVLLLILMSQSGCYQSRLPDERTEQSLDTHTEAPDVTSSTNTPSDDPLGTKQTDSTAVDTDTQEETAVIQIEVTPLDVYLRPGDTVPLTATCLGSDGETNECTDDVAWQSSHENIVDVDPHGNASGIGEGDASITAFWRDIMSNDVMVYSLPFIDAIPVLVVSPSEKVTLVVGETFAFDLDCDWILDVDCAQGNVWISTTPGVADFLEAGVLTAFHPGITTIYNNVSSAVSNRVIVHVFELPVI